MGHVVFNTLQKLERRILQNNATVSQPDAWPEVTGVSSWLGVVWWNLLANPLQLARHPLRIHLGWTEENGGCRFWVRDNAGGVPLEKRDKLFQPFESLCEPHATHGLGLSIAQRLVDLQSGKCGYEPHADGGSIFYFTLPVTPEGGDQAKDKVSTRTTR